MDLLEALWKLPHIWSSYLRLPQLAGTFQSHPVAAALIPVLPTVILVRRVRTPKARGGSSLQVRSSPPPSLSIARPGASCPPHPASLTGGQPGSPRRPLKEVCCGSAPLSRSALRRHANLPWLGNCSSRPGALKRCPQLSLSDSNSRRDVRVPYAQCPPPPLGGTSRKTAAQVLCASKGQRPGERRACSLRVPPPPAPCH